MKLLIWALPIFIFVSTLAGCQSTIKKYDSSNPSQAASAIYIDCYDRDGKRTGYEVKRGQYIDQYDTSGKRIGYKKISGNYIDLYDVNSRRMGYEKVN
jgi:type II secretory pathway component PulC